MKRNILLTALILSLLAVPANADLAVLERGLTSGRIIYSVSDSAYLSKSGKALTESSIAKLSSSDYSKTGLVADGNTRLILRYQSESAGSVTFSVSPEIAGSRLERFTNRHSSCRVGKSRRHLSGFSGLRCSRNMAVNTRLPQSRVHRYSLVHSVRRRTVGIRVENSHASGSSCRVNSRSVQQQ